MNWKEEVTEKLRRYPAMASAAATIPGELARLEQEACTVQSAQFGRSGLRSVRAYEDRLLNITVKQQELESQLCSVESWLQTMDRALQRLPEWEKRVLELLYMERSSATQACQTLGMERSSLYRLRDTALKNLTLCMYGALES